MRKIFSTALAFVFVFMAVSTGPLSRPAFAEEGMWTFDNPPLKELKDKHGFTPSQGWLDHIRLASIRFMDGGSGSFISPNGLILTNHHVALGQLQKLSTAEKNYAVDGFYAPTTADELKCPDLEVNVLLSLEDVTDRIKAAVKPGMTDAEALRARRAETAAVERESLEKTGLRSNVVALYHGGEYWLHRYKKYTDLRLVMAPEQQAAYFGGDSDNFTYPRHDLDMAFFRAYENDEPVASAHYLKWNPRGLAEGDLVFVSGHPGSTDRLYTAARLAFQRDVHYPLILKYIDRYLDILRAYAAGGEEQRRRAMGRIFGLENARKAMGGEHRGLQDVALMARHRRAEEEFRARVAADPDLETAYGDGWETIAQAVALDARDAEKRFYRRLIGSQLASRAGTIVRYVAEVKKPDGDRLPGFHDSELEELRFNLLSPAPVYKDLEEWLLGSWMEWSLHELGPEDAFMKALLDGDSPRTLAKKVISGTRLDNVAFRKSLLDGGERAVRNSKDPLIVLLRKLDPMMRESEAWRRENIESALSSGGEKIAQARFAVYGKTAYPDATFTLRLSYGTAVGYPMNGTRAPYMTTLYGLFDRALGFGDKGDWALPPRFWERQSALDLATPVNFVSTNDIIGGNSGSPVVNRDGELVGLIFDGNIESLVGRFVYDETVNRAVSVHCAFMLEALRKLYDAGPLADEIMAGR